MGSLIVISWRDIPAQVIAKQGRDAAKVQLSHRFQEAVDRAAMRAGKGSSDAYLADWARSTPRPCGDDLQAEACPMPEPRRLPSPADVRGQAMVGAPRARHERFLSALRSRAGGSGRPVPR